jgi:MraZ protein
VRARLGGEIHSLGSAVGLEKEKRELAGLEFSYRSQDFSRQRDKGRFVLPSQIRGTVKQSSGNQTTLCLVKHDRWPCLTGFGLSRVDGFEAELDAEQERKIRAGEPFDREIKAMQLYGFSQVPFDGSGRFVLPGHLETLSGITDKMFFNGLGAYFTIWAPDELYKMDGPEWEGLKAICRLLDKDGK